MKNEIVMRGKTDLCDHELRAWVDKLFTKVETLNDRTKRQTLQIRDLEKKIKEVQKCVNQKS